MEHICKIIFSFYRLMGLDARLTCLLLKCSCLEKGVVVAVVVVVYVVCLFLCPGSETLQNPQ